MRNLKPFLFLILALCLALQGVVVHLSPWMFSNFTTTIVSGVAIFGAAFMLTWAAELIQFDVPEAFAIALVALIAVLPEYAVDIYFAWRAGQDPSYISYATANMTGANRLLIGVGWAAVLLAFWFKYKKGAILLDRQYRLELFALLAVTVYSFVIPLKGTLSGWDSLVLLSIFGYYLVHTAKAHHSEPELEEGTAAMLARLSPWPRRFVAVSLFLLAAGAILLSAEPFSEGLLKIGERFGIEKFILVQWIAPLASESPEFIVAILFALKARPMAGLGTLISSKVNQWALLMGTLPLAYALSLGDLQPMVLDARQVEEIFLTAAQSFFAITVLINLSFSLREALILLVFFATQLFFPDPSVRWNYSFLYLILGVFILVFFRSNRQGLLATLRREW